MLTHLFSLLQIFEDKPDAPALLSWDYNLIYKNVPAIFL